MSEKRSQTSDRRPFIIAAVLIVAVVIGAWVLQAGATNEDESSGGDSSSSYSVKIERGGEVLKEYDLAALQSLPQATVTIDGKEQNGPYLSTVLDDAGAGAYESVAIRGVGIRDDGAMELTAAQVPEVQFDFAERGTVKVCGPGFDRDVWVRDVLTIVVE